MTNVFAAAAEALHLELARAALNPAYGQCPGPGVSQEEAEAYAEMAQRKLDDARVALALFEPLALAWYKANKGEVDLHDVVTHREAWRKALSIAQATALPPGHDHDDQVYWGHELDVYDRTFEVLAMLYETSQKALAR